jgi:aspartyl aminopeptidase
MSEYVADLLAFIDRSPTPYHAVSEATLRLEQLGYDRISESDVWELGSGSIPFIVATIAGDWRVGR